MFWRFLGEIRTELGGRGVGKWNSRRFESCSVNNQLHQQRELGRCSVELRRELLVSLALFQLNFRFYQQTVLWLRKYFRARQFLGFGGRLFCVSLLDFSIRMLIETTFARIKIKLFIYLYISTEFKPFFNKE